MMSICFSSNLHYFIQIELKTSREVNRWTITVLLPTRLCKQGFVKTIEECERIVWLKQYDKTKEKKLTWINQCIKVISCHRNSENLDLLLEFFFFANVTIQLKPIIFLHIIIIIMYSVYTHRSTWSCPGF